MAIRRVRGVSRVGDTYISGVCNPGEDWQYRRLEDVVADIETGRHTYYVAADGAAEPARIHVVHEPLGPYLRTDPDATAKNNLKNLPSCEAIRSEQRILPTLVRRNIATVSRAERARLRDAILELNKRFYPVPAGKDPVSIWFKQDQIHAVSHVHDQVSFLAFHRFLVNEFEAQLQKIDPGLALHYWDWTTDPRRASNGQGGTVDLMTPNFMGASKGSLGSPFLEAGFYKSDAPNRDEDAMGPRTKGAPELPPRDVARAVLSSGHGPADTTYDDVPELYDDVARTERPRSDQTLAYRLDRDPELVFVRGRPGVQFERFWRALWWSHGVAHRYLGGGLRPSGSSFEDPFVYLLHSNVDRLWASWQLRADYVGRNETSFRLDPDYVYGQLIDGVVERPDFAERDRYESQADYDERRRAVGVQSRRELTTPMSPFSGPAGFSGYPLILPWSVKPQLVTPQSREVLRPPLYDRYVGGPFCIAWPTLRLGLQLARGDVIHLAIETGAVAASDVEFVLEAGPGVFWWKGLLLPDGTVLEVQDATRSSAAVLPLDQVRGGELVFHKLLRLFLFATGRRIVYRLGDLDWIPGGSRLTFYWDDDTDVFGDHFQGNGR